MEYFVLGEAGMMMKGRICVFQTGHDIFLVQRNAAARLRGYVTK
jgi:hypothetical protein